MPTRLAATQPAPRPGPPAQGPAYAAPAPPGPARGGDPARLQKAPHDQQVRRPVNFIAPGVLMMIFSAFSVILAIWAGSIGGFTNLAWPYPKFVELLCLSLWLLSSRGIRFGRQALPGQ
jgi:hypothetical protein